MTKGKTLSERVENTETESVIARAEAEVNRTFENIITDNLYADNTFYPEPTGLPTAYPLTDQNVKTTDWFDRFTINPTKFPNKITLHPENSFEFAKKPEFNKFGEIDVLDEVYKYIVSTYNQHYGKDGVQAFDLIKRRGHARGFCVGNAMKYLDRYGEKDGFNRKDLLKAIHYIILEMATSEEVSE